jgi:hypothetical protein
VNASDLKKVQDKKFLYEILGKYNSDITVEKFVLKTLREQKKQRLRKVKPEERTIFKYKKEPEKNKTHWDHLMEEMVKNYLIRNGCIMILIKKEN